MKKEYWFLIGGLVLGTMFGHKIPGLNKLPM